VTSPMSQRAATPAETVLAGLTGLRPDLESLYTDVHAHPELSMQETGLAGIATRLAGARAAWRGTRMAVIHPTLETGVETFVIAVLAWLAP